MSVLKLIFLGTLAYLIWALIHHKRDKSLTLPILLEYLLVAALALVVSLAVLLP